jgi:alpha-beta hydrolase superfamily lysophospholipase
VTVALRHETGTFAGVGDVDIFWQAWKPEAEPRATVVLAHGASEHSARYEHVARAFNERGYSVWALDHRGHGRSGGDRVFFERFDDVLADLHTFMAQAGAERPGQKPYLLGHSMGGAVATAYAIRHDSELAGLILSNPVASIKTAPVEAIVGRVLSRIAPKLGVYSVPADGVSRDPEEVRKYVEDPLNYHDKLPARTVAVLAREVDTFADRAGQITVPVLIYYSDTDPIVAPEGSRMLAERVGSKDVTVRNWDGLRHEILNEPERDEVIAGMLEWLDAHATGGA